MLKSIRRSLAIIFCAYMIFVPFWAFYVRLNDPLSWWNPIASAHPEIALVYHIFVNVGEIAFLLLLIGGIPLVFSSIKQAMIEKRRSILRLFVIAGAMLLVFVAVTILVIAGLWRFDPNGGIYAIISLATLLTLTITLARAVLKSEPGERVLRFALIPAVLLTAAMGIVLIATLMEVLLFALNSPRTLNGSDIFNWLAGDAVLAVATGIALFALRRGMLARRARTA